MSGTGKEKTTNLLIKLRVQGYEAKTSTGGRRRRQGHQDSKDFFHVNKKKLQYHLKTQTAIKLLGHSNWVSMTCGASGRCLPPGESATPGLVLGTGDTSMDSVAGVFPRPGQRPGGLVLATVDLKNFHFPLGPEVSPLTSLTHSGPYSSPILFSSNDHQTLEHKFSLEFQA